MAAAGGGGAAYYKRHSGKWHLLAKTKQELQEPCERMGVTGE